MILGYFPGILKTYSRPLIEYYVSLQSLSSEPPKIYPAHLLFTDNYRLPIDVDRCQLEVQKNLFHEPSITDNIEIVQKFAANLVI